MKKIGIIGCGTIGVSLALTLKKEFSSRARLTALCEHHAEKAIALQKKVGIKLPVISLDQLIRTCDIIIEAASASISGDVAEKALRLKGKDVLIMSVGGLLAKPGLLKGNSASRLWIPSGAVAGIDALLAAKEAKIQKVKLTTRKPPAGLNAAPYFISRRFPALKGNEEKMIFRGSAREAVKNFPQNINVAAILSLAGIGANKTEVEIWTSRRYKSNRHEILITSDSGTIHTVTDNRPSRTNPKTSALAVHSATAVLRRIFSSVHVGT